MKKIYLVLTFIIFTMSYTKCYASNFIDINNHWAKEEIEESISNDIISGYQDSTFRPNNSVTIAEYLKIIIKSGKYDLVKKGNYFPDYFIETAKKEGLILENEFEDYNKKLTRNEASKITARYIKVENVDKAKIKFKDLDSNYKSDIQKLVKLGVIKGYEDNTFRGDKEVTRAEAIVISKRATDERRRLAQNREYNDLEKVNYTNIKTTKDLETPIEIGYEIKNKKIYIYDSGRYSNLQNYEIKDENIDITKTIKIINSLVDEDSYTEVLYVPFEEIVNQLIIRRGENKNILSAGGADFEITYYENKPYELKKITQEETFSDSCYMKIEVIKMWRDNSKLSKGEFVDEFKKEKLEKFLEIEFGVLHKDIILKYMLKKYEDKISGESRGEREVEQVKFGKYILNYYKKPDGNPTFYISKI